VPSGALFHNGRFQAINRAGGANTTALSRRGDPSILMFPDPSLRAQQRCGSFGSGPKTAKRGYGEDEPMESEPDYTGNTNASSSVSDQRNRRRAVIASTIGAIIEWYDFGLYSIAAGLVFPALFFPNADPLVGTINSFVVFAVGYITACNTVPRPH
jgi:hypothetical protein